MGDVQSAVVALNQVAGNGRAGPERVVVGVDVVVRGNGFPGAAPVFGLGHQGPQGVQGVFPERVHIDLGIVEGAVANFFFVGNPRPLYAAVLAAVQGIFLFVFDQRIHNVGVGAGYGKSHASQVSGGQPVFVCALDPGVSAVVGDVQTAAGPAAFEQPRPPAVFPHGSKQLVRILRVHDQVCGSAAVVGVQDFFPAFTAVLGAVNAAVLGVPVRQADGGYKHVVGIARVHHNAVNALGFFQAHALPGASSVQTAEQTVSNALGVPGVALAGAHPDHVGVAGVHLDGANGGIGLVVPNGLPALARVGAFPQTARSRTHVDHFGVYRIDVDGGHPAAHSRWSDVPELHVFQQVIRKRRSISPFGLGGRGPSAAGGKCHHSKAQYKTFGHFLSRFNAAR